MNNDTSQKEAEELDVEIVMNKDDLSWLIKKFNEWHNKECETCTYKMVSKELGRMD